MTKEKTVYLDIDGRVNVPVRVEPVTGARRAHLLATYPDPPDDATSGDVNKETFDWFAELVEASADIEGTTVHRLDVSDTMVVGASIVSHALQLDSSPTSFMKDGWMVVTP